MRIALTCALIVATSLTGCAALGVGDGDDGDLEIAAAFYPLAYVSERVSGQDVDLLTTPGAEPHDFELTIKETAQVAGADLVVYERDFQPAVDAAVDETAEGVAIDAADVVGLLEGHEEEEAHADSGEAHDHEDGVDPHFWLDPLRMADLGDEVALKLAELDPDHRQDYRDNAADLRLDMERLDREFVDGLAGCRLHTVVVSHDAFGYLEKFGLHFESIAGLSPDAEPTPAHLAELQNLAREEGVTTVFTETLGSSKMADTLARDLGLRTLTLDPLEGLAEGSSDDYVSVMRRNLANLKAANEC